MRRVKIFCVPSIFLIDKISKKHPKVIGISFLTVLSEGDYPNRSTKYSINAVTRAGRIVPGGVTR